MNKLATLALAGLMAVSLANAQDIKPTRVGPVSQYGELITGKNSSGKGRIYGSCEGAVSGSEVQVQGMSLFWSISKEAGGQFWTADIVNGLVARQNIQLIRAPMGVDENWGEGNYFTEKSYYQDLMNNVVKAAIVNDIYVIIDYHSHNAHSNPNNAKDFFEEMASKWGQYDNVIFEVYNEPTGVSWSTVKEYAEEVLKVIRKYSDNLVVVGNHDWDQHPEDAVGQEIKDPNVAYTFHFYAGEDQWRHTTDNQGANAVKAIDNGLSVFVTEWGNSAPSGNGGFNSSYSTTWLNWMNKYQLSGANWSVSTKDETASYFSGTPWNYSQSGNWVNTNIFSKLPKSYTSCKGEEQEPEEEESAISLQNAASLNFSIAGSVLNLVGAKSATVDVFDLQGRSVLGVKNVKSSVELAGLKSGAYIVRVKDGSASLTRKVSIR